MARCRCQGRNLTYPEGVEGLRDSDPGAIGASSFHSVSSSPRGRRRPRRRSRSRPASGGSPTPRLDAAAAGIAAGLREAGVGAEEPVGICLPRSWEGVSGLLGTVRAGGACLPLDPSSPPARRAALLELAGARVVLSDRRHGRDLPPDVTVLDPAALASQPGEAAVAAGGERLAYLVFTSGSTGTPKGVEITHGNLVHLFGTGSDLVPVPGDVVIAAAAIEFDIAILEAWGALAAGARLVLAPAGRPDPRQLGRLIAERGVSFAFFAAGLFEQVTRAALPDLAGLRLIAAGGDVMPPAAAAAIRAAHPGVRLVNGYGPTESSIVASAHAIDRVDGSPLPIGRPLPGYRFHVLGEGSEPVEPGEPGELWISGPGVARGYRGDPELTGDRFRPDPSAPGERMYASGDLVRWREDGELLFLGRRDLQVKIAGYRVEPGEVEQVLGTHPGVGQAAVVAREDVAGHKRLVAYAAPRAGADPQAADLRDHLAARLPAYMVPAAIELLPELPLTERGKIDRAALPAPRRAEPAAASGRVAAVAELMAELLEVERIGPDDDFLALGADSLLALQLIGRLRDRFGGGIGIDVVFQAPTPRRLAARLDGEEKAARPPLERLAPAGRTAPATFAQRRAWLFERMNPDSLAYQFAALLHFEGELDEGALRGALGDLMARHEVLRSSIEERDGEPVQVVHEQVEVPLEVVDLPGESSAVWARLVRSRVRSRIALERAPLVRWTLVRRGHGRWSLIDVEHHAVHDGWSFMLVLSELAELYSSRVERRRPRLPRVDLRLADFAVWERALASGEAERRQLDYWCRTLDPDPALLELPTSRPRPPRESFAGGSVRRPMPPRLATAIAELARTEGVTSFMAGLAAFAVLLGRCAEQDRVQIGTGLANRGDPAAERLVGMTVGTVALAVDLSGDPTVRELLRRTRSTVLDAIANADVPFERVVDALGARRQASRSPLVQTLFSFDDAPRLPGRWAELDVRVVQTVPNGTAKADLNVIGVDHGDGRPFLIWEHSELFTGADADRLAARHLRLLEQFVAEPAARLSELSPLGAEEEAELAAWRGAPGGFDRAATIPDLVARQRDRDPGAVALIDGRERLSYAELVRRARAVAGRAARPRGGSGRRGRGPGAPLGPRRRSLPRRARGGRRRTCRWTRAHPAARTGRSLADAGARVALADPGLEELLPAGVVSLDPRGRRGLGCGSPARARPRPESLAYVMYTSGSTGEPKGVEVTHRNVIRLVDDPGFADLGPGTVMLHAASPAFDATTLELWGPLANGGTVAILAEQPSPDSVAAAVAAHGVTTMWLTAGLFHELVDRRPECLRQVRHLLAGGDVLSPSHVARALAALPAGGRLSNGYGPTETTTFALTHELRPGDRVGTTVPSGRPVQGTVCQVLDAAGRPVPIGVAGELLDRRRGRRPRLPRRPGADREALPPRPRESRRTPVPQRRPRPLACRRHSRVPRPDRPPDQGPRGSGRAGRGGAGAARASPTSATSPSHHTSAPPAISPSPPTWSPSLRVRRCPPRRCASTRSPPSRRRWCRPPGSAWRRFRSTPAARSTATASRRPGASTWPARAAPRRRPAARTSGGWSPRSKRSSGSTGWAPRRTSSHSADTRCWRWRCSPSWSARPASACRSPRCSKHRPRERWRRG